MKDLDRAVAKMFCVGFAGTTVTPEMAELIDRGVSGAVYFGRNFGSAQQFMDLGAELKQRAGWPFLTCIDHEGGRVIRLGEPFTQMPAMRAVGQTKDVDLARHVGRVYGRELRAVNVDMNFAPVLDVDTNPANPVIAARSFGRDPNLVAEMGCALLAAMQAEGVAACGKHFPGHGDTSQDSHLDLPRLPHPMDRLNEVELVPFRAAIRGGIAAIMTAHVVFEAIDPQHPATMSRDVLDGLLRQRMGFDGVLATDSMEMKAVADHFGTENAVVAAAAAGADLLLVSHHHPTQHRCIDRLIEAVNSGRVPRQRIEESGRRIDAMIARYARPPVRGPVPEVIGCAEHRDVAERIKALSEGATQDEFDPTDPRRFDEADGSRQ